MPDNQPTAKSIALKSLLWRFLEMFGRYGIQFILQIVMARILCPSDYGAYAIVIALVTIASSYIAGLPQSLIQDKDDSKSDWNTVLWFLLLVTAVVYAFLFFAAPLIAAFYGNPDLTLYLRIAMLVLFFAVYQEMQAARLIREFRFKSLFFRSLFGVIVSGIIGVCAAVNGLGTWALIFQYFSVYVASCLVLFAQNRWLPRPRVRLRCIKRRLPFSCKYFFSTLLKNNYDAIGDLIFGRVMTAVQMGLVERGRKFGQSAFTIIDNPIQTVFLSFLSRMHHENRGMLDVVRIVVSAYSSIAILFYALLIVFSRQIVVLLFGDQWADASVFFCFYCLMYIPMSLTTVSYQAFNAKGRTGIPLACGAVRLVTGIVFVCSAVLLGFGSEAVVAAWCIASACASLFVAIPNRMILGYSIRMQLKDFFVPLVSAVAFLLVPCCVVGCCFAVSSAGMALSVGIGCILYVLALRLTGQKALELLDGFLPVGRLLRRK